MLSNLGPYISNARKAIIQVTGLVVALLALGVLPDNIAGIAATVVAVLTTITHYLVPNADAPGDTPAVEDVHEAEEPQDEWKPAELVTAGQVANEQSTELPLE
jgi:hypothetical protein